MAGRVAEFEVQDPWSLNTSRRFWEGFPPAALAGEPVRRRAGGGPRRERPDALPHQERRLDAEIAERYGPGRTLAEVSQAWRPYRAWAAVHPRALREQRTGEIVGR